VDDSVDVTTNMSIVLKHWGYDARAANHVDAALELARAHRPHVVILDVALDTHWNGFGLADEFRSLPGAEEAYMVCMSNFCTREDRERSLKSGFSYHFAKGGDLLVLKRLLEAYALVLLRRALKPAEATQERRIEPS
jgi:CheY-like chemotaxis protein